MFSLKLLILIFLSILTLSCSLSNEHVNRINNDLLAKSKSKYIVVLPSNVKNKENMLEVFKNSIIIYSQFSKKFTTPIIPFWKIKKPYYKNINKLIENKNIYSNDILFITSKIYKIENQYNIQINLLNSNKEEIFHLISKTSTLSNLDLKNSLIRIIDTMIRFMKLHKAIEFKPNSKNLNIIYILKNQKISKVEKIKIIKLLYPKIDEDEIEKFFINKNSLFLPVN